MHAGDEWGCHVEQLRLTISPLGAVVFPKVGDIRGFLRRRSKNYRPSAKRARGRTFTVLREANERFDRHLARLAGGTGPR